MLYKNEENKLTMSKAFIDRNQQQNSNENQTDIAQKKIDPVAQLKWLNNQKVDQGWGVFNNDQPTQMFAQEEEEEPVQGKAEEDELQMKSGLEGETEKQGSSGTKTGMPDEVRSKMENSFGADFSSVNIHRNSDQASNIGALAYTQGNDVHFAPGQYNPGSTKGQELLGHELTHVVQQRQGKVRPDAEQKKGMNINSDSALEKEADVMGEKAAQGKMADVTGNGSGLQRKGENNKLDDDPVMTEEHIQRAIDCNNNLGLSALSISYLQMGLCLIPTGEFDKDTVLAIGKVSIENRVEPFLTTLSDSLLREHIEENFQKSLNNNEKDLKKFSKNNAKLNRIGDDKSKKKSKLESSNQEIKDKYITSGNQEHLLNTESIESSTKINQKIDDIRRKFSASDGELDISAFNTIFQRMVNEKMYHQLLQLSIEYEKLNIDKNTLAVNYDSKTTNNYRVKVPFSQLEVNNEYETQTISNAPNLLKNIFIGEGAFGSYSTLISNLTSANLVKVEQNIVSEENTTESTEDGLSKKQVEAAISNNSFIFSEERSIRLIQAIIGAPSTGVFDENTIRSVSTYQGANSISRIDGNLDKDTINGVLTDIINSNEQNAALSIMKDFYSLEITSDKEILLKYSADQKETFQRDESLPGMEQITFDSSVFANGLTSLHDSFKDAFGYEKTIEHEMMETLLSNTNLERQSAVWSNPNTSNQDGLVASIRENFPEEQDISNYLSRTDVSNEDKIAALGELSVELGRLEFLMGVIYHGGNNKIWETSTPTKNNKGPFVNYYKSLLGNGVNDSAWCTMFSGYLKRMLGFSAELSSAGPLIFNSGIRLDRWATDGMNVVTGVDDFDDPTNYDNYTGNSIDTEDWISLRNDLNVQGLTADQKQQTLNTFLNDRFTPQPGDIIVMNPQSTASNEPNKYHNSQYSHTLTVETFNSPIITTIEGNKDHKTTGTSLDLSKSSDVIKILFIARIGVEFFPQNEQDETIVEQNTNQISLNQILDPLKIMVRNLQLLSDHKGYINSNTENAIVYDMGDGSDGGETN